MPLLIATITTPQERVYVQYSCESDDSLSIVIRDGGEGFDPTDVQIPKDMGEDSKRGIHLMTSLMDEVQFRKNGTEVYMRMTGASRSRTPEEDWQPVTQEAKEC